MRFAVDVPNFGDFADPLVVADLARRAEDAGWDGLFVWDHVTHRKDLRRTIADPWVLLTAAALATQRIRLGTLVTPVARRRVSKLAREVTTLDRLTGGRMILGAGLGAPVEDEFGTFGETTDPRELAARLDEGLTALNLLWSGEPVTFHGAHVVVDDVAFLPTPVQRPRVPVWVGGVWPARPPMRRAARWDGAAPILPIRRRRLAATAGCRHGRADQRVPARLPGRGRARWTAVRPGHVRHEPGQPGRRNGPSGVAGAGGRDWWAECNWDDLERPMPCCAGPTRGRPAAKRRG